MERAGRPGADHYAEAPPAASLRAHAACMWMRHVRNAAGGLYRIIPDGCMDIIWDGRSLQVAGPDTGPVLTALQPGARLVAVRFRPGAAPAVLGVPAADLRNGRVDLEELWGRAARRLAERLGETPDGASVTRELQRTVASRVPGGPDPLVQGMVEAATVRTSDPAPVSVAALAQRLGYSERQLRRRCLAAFGYGPATLRRVLRFRRAVTLARSGHHRSHADLAAALGYTDQSHLARDVRDLAGIPLRALVEDAAPRPRRD